MWCMFISLVVHMMSVSLHVCGSEREGQTVGGSAERRPETEGRESKGPHCKDWRCFTWSYIPAHYVYRIFEIESNMCVYVALLYTTA